MQKFNDKRAIPPPRIVVIITRTFGFFCLPRASLKFLNPCLHKVLFCVLTFLLNWGPNIGTYARNLVHEGAAWEHGNSCEGFFRCYCGIASAPEKGNDSCVCSPCFPST